MTGAPPTRPFALDALLPPEMALKAEQIGVTKAGLNAVSTFVLGVLAGAFIALGAIFATAVASGAAGVRHYAFDDGAIGAVALATARHKVGLGFGQAIALGILANGLVCLAVWLTFSARTTTDRVLAIVPPIAAFVAAGFEHSIANMNFVPIAVVRDPKPGAGDAGQRNRRRRACRYCLLVHLAGPIPASRREPES